MNEELKQSLQRIENELIRIRESVRPGWSDSAKVGAWRGAGFILGTVIGIALFSILLSALGIIPGFAAVAQYLQDILQSLQGNR